MELLVLCVRKRISHEIDALTRSANTGSRKMKSIIASIKVTFYVVRGNILVT